MNFKIDSLEIIRNLKEGDIIMQHADSKEKYIIQSINEILIMVFRSTSTVCSKTFPVTHLITDNWFIESNNGSYLERYT